MKKHERVRLSIHEKSVLRSIANVYVEAMEFLYGKWDHREPTETYFSYVNREIVSAQIKYNQYMYSRNHGFHKITHRTMEHYPYYDEIKSPLDKEPVNEET